MYLVKLKQKQLMDHCVVVNWNSCVFIDSAERYPLTLSADVLRICGIDSASNLVVAELREVVSTDEILNLKQKKNRKVIDLIE